LPPDARLPSWIKEGLFLKERKGGRGKEGKGGKGRGKRERG